MTARICAVTMPTGTWCTSRTSLVFCAVTAVTAVVANTPRAAIVLMSAWMPAPDPESDPAMVRTTGGLPPMLIGRSFPRTGWWRRHGSAG